jgi:hypothetical protein
MLTNINPTRAKKAQYIRILFPPSLFLKYSGIVKAYENKTECLLESIIIVGSLNI